MVLTYTLQKQAEASEDIQINLKIYYISYDVLTFQ